MRQTEVLDAVFDRIAASFALLPPRIKETAPAGGD
jgi:hypothetical protein